MTIKELLKSIKNKMKETDLIDLISEALVENNVEQEKEEIVEPVFVERPKEYTASKFYLNPEYAYTNNGVYFNRKHGQDAHGVIYDNYGCYVIIDTYGKCYIRSEDYIVRYNGKIVKVLSEESFYNQYQMKDIPEPEYSIGEYV